MVKFEQAVFKRTREKAGEWVVMRLRRDIGGGKGWYKTLERSSRR